MADVRLLLKMIQNNGGLKVRVLPGLSLSFQTGVTL